MAEELLSELVKRQLEGNEGTSGTIGNKGELDRSLRAWKEQGVACRTYSDGREVRNEILAFSLTLFFATSSRIRPQACTIDPIRTTRWSIQRALARIDGSASIYLSRHFSTSV